MTSQSMHEKLLKEAVKSCLDNVEQYLKDARMLIENESYGHAFALTVLGEEELSKAFIYYMCSEGWIPESFIKRVGRRANSHRRKQVIAATFSFTFGITEFFKNLMNSSKEEGEGDPRKTIEIANKKLKEAMDYMQKNKDEMKSRMDQFLERFATLEEDKEKGLYVDVIIEEGVFTSPKSLEKDVVEEHLAQVKKQFQFVKPLLMMTLSPSERKQAKALIKESGILQGFLEAI